MANNYRIHFQRMYLGIKRNCTRVYTFGSVQKTENKRRFDWNDRKVLLIENSTTFHQRNCKSPTSYRQCIIEMPNNSIELKNGNSVIEHGSFVRWGGFVKVFNFSQQWKILVWNIWSWISQTARNEIFTVQIKSDLFNFWFLNFSISLWVFEWIWKWRVNGVFQHIFGWGNSVCPQWVANEIRDMFWMSACVHVWVCVCLCKFPSMCLCAWRVYWYSNLLSSDNCHWVNLCWILGKIKRKWSMNQANEFEKWSYHFLSLAHEK